MHTCQLHIEVDYFPSTHNPVVSGNPVIRELNLVARKQSISILKGVSLLDFVFSFYNTNNKPSKAGCIHATKVLSY